MELGWESGSGLATMMGFLPEGIVFACGFDLVCCQVHCRLRFSCYDAIPLDEFMLFGFDL